MNEVRYVMCPLDLLDETWYRRLKPRFPDLAERVFRLVMLAHQFEPTNGRILGSKSQPLEAEDIASRCPDFSEEEVARWEDLLVALAGAGILVRDDAGGWALKDRRAWWRLKRETEEAQAEKKARQRAARPPVSPSCPPVSPCVPPVSTPKQETGNREQEIDPPPPPSSEGHEPAAPADEEEAPASQPDLPPAPDWTPRGNGLEALRPVVGRAMQDLGILASPTGRWWTQFAEWAAPALAEHGATAEDILAALAFGRDAAIDQRPKVPWPWAMTVAAGELGTVVERRQRAERALATGKTPPRPHRYEPQARGAPPPLPVTSSEALLRGGGRC